MRGSGSGAALTAAAFILGAGYFSAAFGAQRAPMQQQKSGPASPLRRTINVPPLSFEGTYVRNRTIDVSALSFEGLYGARLPNKTVTVAPLVFEGLYVSPKDASSTFRQVAPAVKTKGGGK